MEAGLYHGVRIVAEGLHEINNVLMNVGVRHYLARPNIQLALLGQLAVHQEIRHLHDMSEAKNEDSCTSRKEDFSASCSMG